MDNTKKIQTALVCVTTAAILIGLLYAIPVIMTKEVVMRTDSAS